jgi:hypothetical protein
MHEMDTLELKSKTNQHLGCYSCLPSQLSSLTQCTKYIGRGMTPPMVCTTRMIVIHLHTTLVMASRINKMVHGCIQALRQPSLTSNFHETSKNVSYGRGGRPRQGEIFLEMPKNSHAGRNSTQARRNLRNNS